jgi:hypothetical protein
MRVGDDRAALRLGGLGEAALADEERGLFLCPADDAFRLFLCLLDDPLALGVDALGGADLLGYGDPEFVDQAERGVLVDDDVRRERQLLAVRDEGFEALDEEDDVDRSALQAGGLGYRVAQADCKYGTPAPDVRAASTQSPALSRRTPGPSRRHRRRSSRSP